MVKWQSGKTARGQEGKLRKARKLVTGYNPFNLLPKSVDSERVSLPSKLSFLKNAKLKRTGEKVSRCAGVQELEQRVL